MWSASSVLLGLVIFVTSALGDWAWTLFIRGVEERRPRIAVPASMFLWLLGAVGIVGLVADPWVVTPAGTLGAGFGVWAGIKTARPGSTRTEHVPRALSLCSPSMPITGAPAAGTVTLAASSAFGAFDPIRQQWIPSGLTYEAWAAGPEVQWNRQSPEPK